MKNVFNDISLFNFVDSILRRHKSDSLQTYIRQKEKEDKSESDNQRVSVVKQKMIEAMKKDN